MSHLIGRPRASLDHLVMIEQFATAGCGATHLDSLDEVGVIFEHSVNGFLDELRWILARAGRNLSQPDFFVG